MYLQHPYLEAENKSNAKKTLQYSVEGHSRRIEREHHITAHDGGLGVKCSPQDPRFVSSNPAEVDGFFRA